MGETKSADEPALPAKRKPDLTSQDQENLPLKSRKLQTQDETIQPKDDSFVPDNEEPGVDAEEEGEEDDDDYKDDDDHDGEENGNATVDRKGKGILIEDAKDSDDDDDDDDDSSDGGDESEGESDLSDDPLAEVDLDNILPSRTRRRVVQPGVYIAKDVGNNDESDDSDGSDT
ncbi:hypothetical protein QUC31_017929 [Theobroma cacao]|uniref:Nucleolin n=1 Tax=Theobroma cacao TaxID=3641 RepID=A0A061EES9_THECC|nr:Uncharacterized protein TCM_017311 [Theobroma cacao]